MRWPTHVALLALCMVGACSLLLDPDARQCRSDGDCARFAGASCDTVAQICRATDGTPSQGGASASQPDAPLASSGEDGGTLPGTSGCDKPNKPLVTLQSEIAADDHLDCNKEYLLVGTVLVKAGVTLTIAPGTLSFRPLTSMCP